MTFYYFKHVCIILCLIFTSLIFSQTTLSAGDIAIVGVNTDNPDEFSFLLLTDITSGTEIYFTDSGISSDGSFRNSEGAILYTAPSDLNAGTVINFIEISGDFANASDANVGNNGFNLSASGDQIFAFIGSTSNPTFIFALQTNSSVFQAGANNSNDSLLPSGLTVGTTAVAVGSGSGDGDEYDNSTYNLSITNGDKATLLAAIANNTNWAGNNTLIDDLPSDGGFTVTNSGSSTTTPIVSQIEVKGNDIVIANGDDTPNTIDGTDFGYIAENATVTSSFTIENDTAATITVSEITITGSYSANFSLDSNSITLPVSISAAGSKTFTIEFSSTIASVSNNATIEVVNDSNNISFDITADIISLYKISEIQGSTTISPMENEVVIIEGIVVGDFQSNGLSDGDLGGFFVQEEDVDADGDTRTSEGIFIFDGYTPTLDIAVGDKVSITGTVSEYYGSTQISSTSDINIISSGNLLPTATVVNLPSVNTIINEDGDLIPDLENVENMLVTFPQTLTVIELFQLDRYGEVNLIQGERPKQFTQNNTPSVSGYANHLEEIASRTIILDDGRTTQNPDPILYPDGSLDSTDAFRMGNTTENLTGIVNYSRASGASGDQSYRIHPTTSPVFTAVNTRNETPDIVGGTLKVASINVLNYFTTIDVSGASTALGEDPRGADTEIEFNRQREKLLNSLIAMDADVLGLVEIENDFLLDSSGNAIQNLVEGLNDELGSDTYAWVDPGTQFIGDDAIAVGVIYKPSSVAIASNTSVEILEDTDLNAIGLGSLPAVFNGNSTSRSPLAVTFTEISSDEIFTVVVNHFKSKGSEGTAATGDTDLEDGAGAANQTRLNAAIALNTWLNTDPTASGDTDFLILGDLNAYASEDPIKHIEEEGYTDLARSFLGTDAYSYVFDGQVGTLDYALSSSSLTDQVTGAIEWHVNADEADALDYNLDFGRNENIFNADSPFRNSDHDPVIVGLNLTSTDLSSNIEVKGNDIVIANGDDTPSTIDGTDFGDIAENATVTSSFTIENDTAATITVSEITITGSYSANFSLDSNSITLPVTISAAGSKTFTIEFLSTIASVSNNATIEVVNDSNNISFDITADITVSYALTTTATNGLVSANIAPTNGTYTDGTLVALTATPNAGYQFDGWSGDASGSTNPLSVTMDADKSVTATFSVIPPAVVYYRLTTSATNGTVTPNITQTSNGYVSGTNISLTATPAVGYQFDGWSGNASGSTNPLAVSMTSAKNITATFSLLQHSLTNTATNGAINADVQPVNGTYDYGTVVELTATPDVGYQFDGWSGDASGLINPLNVTIDADKNITATFSLLQHSLTSSATNGTIATDVQPVNGTYDYGAVIELTATPNAGYQFDGWSGNASGTTNPLSVIMDADKTVTPMFSAVLSTDDVFTKSTKVYPNPVENNLHISLATGEVIKSVEVFTVLGKKVLTANTAIINFSTITSGVYIVKIETTDGKIAVKKIVKK